MLTFINHTVKFQYCISYLLRPTFRHRVERGYSGVAQEDICHRTQYPSLLPRSKQYQVSLS